MRFRLDDNANEAFRFLALGAGTILLLRLLVAGVDHWFFGPDITDELGKAADAFRDGYMLRGNRTLVVDGVGLGSRMALALLFSIACGILFAFIGALFARSFRATVLRSSVQCARFGLLLGLGWGTFAGLFLPPRSAVLDEHAVELIERPALFEAMPFPWPASTRTIPYAAIDEVALRTMGTTFDGCGERHQVWVKHDGSWSVIAGLVPQGPDCDKAIREARSQTENMGVALRAHLAAIRTE